MGLLTRFGNWRRYRTIRRLDKRGEMALRRMNSMRKRFEPQREEEGEMEEEDEEEEDEEQIRLQQDERHPRRVEITVKKTGEKVVVDNITDAEWEIADRWALGSAKGICEKAKLRKKCEDQCTTTYQERLDAKRVHYINGLRERMEKKGKVKKKAKQALSEFFGPAERHYAGGQILRKVFKDGKR